MAEIEVKKINGKPICDDVARASANASVKTVNGVSPDQNGNVDASIIGEDQIRACVERILVGFSMENWVITYTDIGDVLLQIAVSGDLSTTWSFTLEDDSVVSKTIGYQDGMIGFDMVRMWSIPEGKVKLVKNGNTVVWERAPYPEKRPFAVMTWAEIGAVCDAGLASEYWEIGDEKTIALATGEELTMQVCDFDHDIGEDNEPLSMTLAMKNLMEEAQQIDNSHDSISWVDSDIRTKLNTEIYNSLPSDLKALIKPAQKAYRFEADSKSTRQSLDMLWLFSVSEIDRENSPYAHEGNSYSSLSISKVLKLNKYLDNGDYHNGDGKCSCEWWTRSWRYSNLYGIVGSGGITDKSISNTAGICFGFCI